MCAGTRTRTELLDENEGDREIGAHAHTHSHFLKILQSSQQYLNMFRFSRVKKGTKKIANSESNLNYNTFCAR